MSNFSKNAGQQFILKSQDNLMKNTDYNNKKQDNIFYPFPLSKNQIVTP